MTLQKKATIISSITAFFLAITKLFVGIFSGSVAILSSAIDSLLDMCVSLFNLFAVSSAEKKPDEQFNYGRGKIEALASFLEGIIITLSGIYILYESVKKIIFEEKISSLDIGIYVMIFSIIITGALVYFLNYVAKKTDNLVIKADALHYKTDLFSNAGILIGLIIIQYSGLYIIDSLIGIGISIYIIFEAYKIMKEGYLLLLDVALDEDEISKITEIVNKQKIVSSFHDLKTRKSGNIKVVNIHLVFNPKISLLEAHKVSDVVEEEIEKIDTNCKWIITVHLDPYDDSREGVCKIK